MTNLALIFGLISFSNADQPVVDFSQAFVQQHSRDQIAQLKERSWTASTADQQLLWTAFWYARMNIIAEDPDIFERAIDILRDISIPYPTDVAEGMQSVQCPILTNTIVQHLETQYNHTLTPSEQQNLTSTCQTQVTEVLMDIEITTWLNAWSSPGGSVGLELWRGTLAKFTQSLERNSVLPIVSDWSLDRPAQLKPPQYVPGQVEGQPTPEEPEISFVHFDRSWNPSSWMVILGICVLLVPFRKHRIVRTLLISTFVFCGLEWICSIFTIPLVLTQPMFQIEGWQITPWKETETHYETLGDYLRTQSISKQTNHPRVVIIGASSAHGSNELWEDSFAGRLQTKTEWDIVNLGIGGTTSTGLVHLRDEIEVLNPDAFIVYYGHNEVRQFRLMQEHLSIAPWKYHAQRLLWQSSVYSTLYNILPKSPSPTSIHSDSTTESSDADIVQLAQWNFESNLTLLCSTLEIPILWIVPPTNYPFAPMIEVNTLPSSIDQIQALIDDHLDATTIHSSIKESIPIVANACGGTLWDVDAHFHQNSPDGTSANGLFWDELHPSELGHAWITRGIQQWLETLPPSSGQQND